MPISRENLRGRIVSITDFQLRLKARDGFVLGHHIKITKL